MENGFSWPSVVRTTVLLALTRLSQQRRAALKRVACIPLLRRFLRLVDGERFIAAGLTRGMRLPPGAVPLDHVHAHSILRGTLEVSVQEALRRTLAPGAVFYDVGANIGFFSLLAARLVGRTGRVIAFEPVPESAESITAASSLNGFGWVGVEQVALGAQAGQGELCVVEDASWSRLMSYGQHALTTQKLPVVVAKLDDLITSNHVPVPDVIKIDVEGAELEVLDGMSQLIEVHQPIIICELHVTNHEFARRMSRYGYRAENLDGPEPIDEAGPNIHVLARPRSRGRTT